MRSHDLEKRQAVLRQKSTKLKTVEMKPQQRVCVERIEQGLFRELRSLIEPAGIEFQADAFRKLTGPIVYIACGKERPLYVGMSSNGIERTMSQSHHALSRIREQITSIKVYACKSTESARAAERILISLLHPPYNKQDHSKHIEELYGARLSTTS